MSDRDDWAPKPSDPVRNPSTGMLELPTGTTMSLPHSVSAWSRKDIDPGAVAAQMQLEQARQAQLDVQDQTIPLDKLPEDLLTPDELERRWEGGINNPQPPQPQIPVSMRPGAAPVAMAPDPNVPPPPPPQPAGITRAEFEDRLARKRAVDTENMEAKLRQQRAEQEAALEAQRQQELAKFNADKAEVARLARPENLFVKPSTGTRILNAIAAAIGAYGATLGRTPNFALDIINKRQDDDMEMRRFQLQTAIKRAEMSGASVEQLQKMAIDGDKRMKEARIEQNHWLDSQMAKMQTLWPAKAQEFAKARADKQAQDVQNTRDFLAQYGGGTKSGTNYGLAVTQQIGSTSTKKPEPVSNVSEAESRAAMYAMRMKRGIEQIDKNPPLTAEDFRTLSNNVLDIKAQAENATKGILSPSLRRKALRAAGLGPESLTSGIKGAGKKAAAIGWLEGAGLIIRYESGAAINIEENMMANLKKIPQGDEATPEGIKMKRDGMEYESDLMMKSAGPAAYYRYMGRYPEGYDEYGRPKVASLGEESGEEESELPGGARVPPEGQTPGQKRYEKEETPEVWRSLEAEGRRRGLDTGEKPKAAKPVTAKEIGKVIPRLSADDKDGVKEASKIKPGSPKYNDAQKYMRHLIDTYGGQ